MATSHDAFGGQQHTAADLLRQSLMHQHGKMAHEDDSHDGIGSGASTPPNGTATPRPDAHQDKRLPALHSYFAQPPTAPSSPRTGTSSPVDSPPLLPHEKKHPDLQTQSSYPTPPLSNSSSFLQMADVEASINGVLPEAPPTRKRSWAQRQQSLTNVPSSLRRNTLSTALTSIVTKSAAAAHISNPSSASQTAPGSPSVARSPSPQSPKQGVEKENQALTQTEPQNTPPQTPRSLSHVSRRDDEAPSVAPIKTSRSSSNNSHGATIGQLKGQLEIVVEEARGLRPATDPYVVCIFQLNEDISAGPKEDEMAVDDQKDPEENLAKGVAMKRMGSGQGTPMAIPGLRSRQTSQTNIADLRRGSHNKQHETTDPVWRHKAVFDVVGDTNEVDVSVYDRANNEQFIGHVRLPLNLDDYEHQHEDCPTMQNQFKGFTFVDESTLEQYMGDRDVNMGDDNNRLSRTFSNRAGDRMSGMEPTSATSADADFNHGMLDDI
ncbi:Serine/threonine-protein kinase SCH9 [Pseudocercospora fuligena]|uniref:Serine/threonine-protein kinase SCH9 n=1 Tax=Pseudocercospora fuligena TaxID=685502 RepID=A0A8H6RIQ3_9PEZI|nr:Serine/threonine-protein kinase SCH9 [Pseudocercospora fuligena]